MPPPEKARPLSKARAGKITELLGGDSYWDKLGNLNSNKTATTNIQILGEHLADEAERTGKVSPDLLSPYAILSGIQRWEDINPILGTMLTPIIKSKVKRGLTTYNNEAVDSLIPFLKKHIKDNPSQAFPEFYKGIVERLPQAASKIPQLIDQLNKPADIDKLPDLRQYLLPDKK